MSDLAGQDERPTQREQVVGLCVGINQVAIDLRVATGVLFDYEMGQKEGRLLKPDALSGIMKMCVGHQVLALSRFVELVGAHWELIPADQQVQCAAIRREFDQRTVQRFRSSVLAHTFDGRGGALMLPSQANERFVEGLGKGDVESWHKWISPWDGDEDPQPGVTQHLQAMRDAIARTHGVSTEELLEALQR